MKAHRLTLNLPSRLAGQNPDPTKPIATLDGLELKGLIGLTILAGSCAEDGAFGRTMVTLVLEVEVDGELDVEEKMFPGA